MHLFLVLSRRTDWLINWSWPEFYGGTTHNGEEETRRKIVRNKLIHYGDRFDIDKESIPVPTNDWTDLTHWGSGGGVRWVDRGPSRQQMRKYRKRWRRRIRTIDCWNLSKTIRKISWNILAMKTVLVAHLLLRLFFFFFFFFSGAHINLRIRFRSKWVELRNLHVIVSGRLFPDYFHPLLCPIIMDERQYVRLAKAFIVLTRFLNVIASFVFGDKSFVLRDFFSFTTIIHSRSYVGRPHYSSRSPLLQYVFLKGRGWLAHGM